jgi:predicted metallopeptidase
MAVAKAPPHVGRTVRKVRDAAKGGTLHQLNAKDKRPLRPGQRHKQRAKKVRIQTAYTEAPEVENRSDKIVGADVWRLRSLAQAKVVFLFSTAERITGCMDGTVRSGRYPRMWRYKAGLKFDFFVLVSRPRWDRASDEEKTQIVFHGLRHLGSDTAGRWRVDPHDHEGFYAEVEFFGVRSPEVKKIAEQLDLFEHRPLKASEKGVGS